MIIDFDRLICLIDYYRVKSSNIDLSIRFPMIDSDRCVTSWFIWNLPYIVLVCGNLDRTMLALCQIFLSLETERGRLWNRNGSFSISRFIMKRKSNQTYCTSSDYKHTRAWFPSHLPRKVLHIFKWFVTWILSSTFLKVQCHKLWFKSCYRLSITTTKT